MAIRRFQFRLRQLLSAVAVAGVLLAIPNALEGAVLGLYIGFAGGLSGYLLSGRWFSSLLLRWALAIVASGVMFLVGYTVVCVFHPADVRELGVVFSAASFVAVVGGSLGTLAGKLITL